MSQFFVTDKVSNVRNVTIIEMPFTKPVVVIDNGGYTIKAGFACDNHPVSMFRTLVGRPKYLNGTYGKGHYEVYIGDEAFNRRDDLELQCPVHHGKIVHWDNMERVWHHIFYRELKAAPEDRAVMLSCAPPTTVKDKVKCCEIFFEALNAPALCIKPQSVLALYGSGIATGLSVDIGQHGTEINPVFEGGTIDFANMSTGYSGDQVSNFISESLESKGYDLGRDLFDTVKAIKKQYLYVTPFGNVPRYYKDYKRTYTLPGGEEIDVSDESYFPGEAFFQPQAIFGKDCGLMPLADAIVTAIQKCDSDLQEELYSSIVPHGGLVSIPGFIDRLTRELDDKVEKPVNVINTTETYAVAWLGGATFAGIRDAKKIWVYKKQFEEQGESIIRKRF